jgi:hypothetical protein
VFLDLTTEEHLGANRTGPAAAPTPPQTAPTHAYQEDWQ